MKSSPSVNTRSPDAVVTVRDRFPEAFGVFYRLFFTRLAARQGWTFIHAAGVVKNDRAYLFAGPSGAGKSTVTRMLGARQIIHDDQVFLAPGGDIPAVTTTPFMGRVDFLHGAPRTYPVEGIYLLHKDSQAYLEKLTPMKALGRILTVPQEELGGKAKPGFLEYLDAGIERCTRLVHAAHCYELHFTLDELPRGLMEAA